MYILTSCCDGIVEGTSDEYGKKHTPFTSDLTLMIIRNAWNKGMNAEDLADGYGVGNGTMNDWSGIRDSSDGARLKMLERALNFLFE